MKHYHPTYSEVLSTISPEEIHRCFIAYEVLCATPSNETAVSYLKSIASKHCWNYEVFMDIIEEEYSCIYCK